MIELDFPRFPVLVVDDEQDNLDAFRFVFRKSFGLHYATSGAEALATLATLDPAVIVCDQRMPGMSGIEVLKESARLRPDAAGILLTAYTDLPVLLEAINSGAVHRYVQKPWDSKELAVILRQAIERFYTVRENRRLREQLARYAGYLEGEHRDPIDFAELTPKSARMRDAVLRLEQLAQGEAPVIIEGEPGTEKELFARALHVSSQRESKPFVAVGCAAWTDGRTEPDVPAPLRELFGWEKDAFEGAMVDRAGRIELAHGGTLLMAEIGEPFPALSERLISLVKQRTARRLGATNDQAIDVRLVLTTSDPKAWGPWKDRLGAEVVSVPPLRERLDDLPDIAERLLARSAIRLGRPQPSFSAEATAALLAYPWPGNYAELAAVTERAVLICQKDVIDEAELSFLATSSTAPGQLPPAPAPAIDLPGQLDDLERRELCAALERCNGNKAEVARMLGIQRTTLYYRLKRLGIDA